MVKGLLEQLIVTQLIKKFLTLYEIQRCIAYSQPIQSNTHFHICFCKIHFNIILIYMYVCMYVCTSPMWSPSLKFSDNFVCISCVSHAFHTF